MARHLRSLLVLGAALLLASVVPASAQTILYVKVGSVGGTGTCASPFGTIASGLAAAKAAGGVTELRITAGTYSESGLVIDFPSVSLKGGYPSALNCAGGDAAIEATRDPVANVTTINPGQAGRHFNVVPATDAGGNFLSSNTGIVFDGIVFTGGRPDPAGNLSGGSIFITNCSARITNSTFRNNGTAGFYANGSYANGGAIYMVGYGNPTASDFRTARLDIDGTLFESNQTGPANSGAGIGGAIYAADFNYDGTVANRQTILNLTNNIFRTNQSNGSGDLTAATQCPDIYADANGDGICDDLDGDGFCDPPDGVGDANDSCPLSDTAGNQVPPNRCHIFAQGGAIYASNVNGTWTGNLFENNKANANQTAFVNFSGNGGAITITSSSVAARAAAPVITNNTFRGNIADAGRGSDTSCGWDSAWGGAAYMIFFRGQLTGNTFEGNQVTATTNSGDNTAWGGGAFILPLGSPVIDGNTFTANQAIGGNGFSSALGGGLDVDDFRQGATPVITNNTFSGNDAAGNVQVSGYGGGLAVASTGYSALVARNIFENNSVSGATGTVQSGWGGGMWGRFASADALVADNIVRANIATPLDPTNFPAQFAGIAMGPALVLDQPDAAARFQNNLIVENLGVGLSLFGFAITGTGSLLNGSELYHNTFANNDQSALFLSLGNSLRLESNIMWGNDALNQGWPDILDDWLGQGPTNDLVAVTNAVQTLPPDPPELLAAFADPANRNLVAVDPQFATDPSPGGGAYYLRQAPDTGAPFSQLVDYGSIPAGQRDFGNNPGYSGQNLALRTTKPVAKTADLCFVDIGFHYPLGAAAPDADGDAIPDADEAIIGTNPNDADTDNDGIIDGLDCGSDNPAQGGDGDGTIGALDCDTDGDGLPDGLEDGLTLADIGADTDTTATCDTSNAPCGNAAQRSWVEDTQPSTTTNPLDYDTDNGGESDGCEDLDHDGRVDPPTGNPNDRDESNPNAPNDDDSDVDGLTNSVEAIAGTSPTDRDTDDDGVADGEEINPLDPNLSSDPVNCDTDADGILDGIERSLGPITVPPDAEPGTKATDCPRDPVFCVYPFCFAADADPTTQTWTACTNPLGCEGFDTDGDGCGDGAEDANQNGRVDAGETDPNLFGDCSGGGGLNYVEITSLTGGVTASCGTLTTPPVVNVLGGTVCDATAPRTGCSATAAITAPAGTLNSGDIYAGSAVLVFFESPDCTQTVQVVKDAAGNVTVSLL